MIKVRVLPPMPINVNIGSVAPVDVIAPNVEIITRSNEEVYNGDVSVVPGIEDVTLNTANKLVESDITVFKIPRFDVSNTEGTTVYIGGTLDGN